MSRKVCMITGGNAGIGRAAAIQLAQQGADVIVASRSQERGDEAVASIRRQTGSNSVALVVMDLSSPKSILAGCEAFRVHHDRLDVLIHNAADFDISRKQPAYSGEGVETVWATNHVGPVFLTQQLGPELRCSEQGRIITVASQGLVMHPFLKVDVDDPEFRGGSFRVDKAYYQSKLAQVMYTYWLAERLRGTSMTINCVRVTNVKIDTDRYPNLSSLNKRLYTIKSRFSLSPERMAEVYVWLAVSPDVATVSGGYFNEKRQPVSSSRFSIDPSNIRRVMELTEKYVPGLLANPV
jgi:NAD(P)-dependent dehydrogenase (short-subunit alcohol dehydrogenase family)